VKRLHFAVAILIAWLAIALLLLVSARSLAHVLALVALAAILLWLARFFSRR
jgi:hypothetical protein